MNYRKGDIVEFTYNKKKLIGKIIEFSGKSNMLKASIIIDGSVKKLISKVYGSYTHSYAGYEHVYVETCYILNVIKRRQGSKIKKKYEMILIDKDGSIID